MRTVLILAALLAASVAPAAEPQPITVWKLDAGYYVVSGSQIVVFPPDGPVVPPVEPAIGLTKAVVAEINKLPATDQRHAAAMKLSKVYEMLAGQKLPPAKAVEAVSAIVKLAVGSDGSAWTGVYAVVNAALSKCTTEAAVSAVLSEASDAVGSTVPAAGDEKQTAEKYGIDWDKFLAFLMQLLTILLPLILKIPV